MANQESLNDLLKWSVANSAASDNKPADPSKGLNQEALAQLLGGPSDADLMRHAMTAILEPFDKVDLENKLVAWDNLEQLIEQIDNANNLEALGMWQPLLKQLDSEDAQMRMWAAACCSTAVQNNVKSQEKLLEHGGIPKLVDVAVNDKDRAARKKAVSALSSENRNFQPGMDELEKALPKGLWGAKRGDAGDMDMVDEVIQRLRDHAARA